jgi:ADP-ribose pyrophosphatase
MGNRKIKNLTLLAGTKFLNLYDAEYINKKLKKRHWIIASRKDYNTLKEQYFNEGKEKTDAVVVVAFHKEYKKLVLIKQYRVPLNDYVYELPAGLVDENEDLETTTARELKEETGLVVTDINYEKTKERVYLSAGMTEESVSLVYCSCEGEISNNYLDDDEDIEVIMVSREEASSLIKENIKFDIKAYMLLQSFIIEGDSFFI